MQKFRKIHGSGVTLVISKEEMIDIMKIVKALEDCGILLKGVTKTIENGTKKVKRGIFRNVLFYECNIGYFEC